MEISMSGPDPPPPKMEKLFLIFLGIRPFFENTLKNSHFALENANFGVEISTKDLKFKVRPRGNFHQVFPFFLKPSLKCFLYF